MSTFVEKLQHAPYSIQIEPTEGCNLGCSFCGLRGMRERGTTPWNFMSLKTAREIASEIARANWPSKIIFAMHGEPTLNPNLVRLINIFRKELPKTVFHLITNGYGIVNDPNFDIPQKIQLLKDAGINHILLDNYSDDGDWSKIVKKMDGIENIEYLKSGIPMFSSKKEFRILVVPPIRTEKISLVRNLTNHCGAAFPLDYKDEHKRCTMPFREMSFRYDGSVALCCDDFRGQYPIGNIFDYEIEALWNHERFQAARIMLYNKERSFTPCHGCTNLSMRVGLLPDPTGQETLPEVTEEVRNLAQSVSKKNSPLSKIIVKRKWEK